MPVNLLLVGIEGIVEANLIFAVADLRNEADMVNLSPESLALAERLAAVLGISVEEAITQAIEQCALATGVIEPPKRDTSPEAIAARIALMEQIADEIAAMPVLDPRSPQEIMDELNEL
jgi:antitoxin VapB